MRNVEETMNALADDQRRELLSHLVERDCKGGVRVSDLADRVSDGDEDEDCVYTRLRHVHLPRLADGGIVSYDRSAETVRLADDTSLVEDVLGAAETFRN
jgi:DNA-binding transcriptional ArsR family regulator